ncbi:MAG: VCBS repeat-containing protein, partial [Bacteroidia bacterium]|nr:VCBS repeat-containing protein [Bacteroidia bacterium]
FLSYQDFAKATLSELFPEEKIEKSFNRQVFELANCYFENNGDGSFERHELPLLSQISSINDIAIDDYNNDGFQDVFLVGNNYEISTQLGKLDASHGIILLNDREGFFKVHVNPNFDVSGPARDIANVKVNDTEYYIIAINNDVPVFLKKNKN